MLGNARIKLQGVSEILVAMRKLPREVNRRKEVLDPGLIAGAVLIRNAARANAPVDTGVVRRNIIVQRWTRAGNGMAATVVVRVRKLKGAAIKRLNARNKAKGLRAQRGDPFYWRFLEFGTSKMPAKPFLRPAFESMKINAVTTAIVVFKNKVQGIVELLGSRR